MVSQPMRLTKQTDYSLRVLMYLGAHQGESATIEAVAGSYSISENHLRKVVHHLSQKGFIETQRGRGGGFRLAREPGRIGLGSVVREMEPDFALVECFEPVNAPCAIYPSCELRGVLQQAMDAWLEVLDRYNLGDLIDKRSGVGELLGIAAMPGQRT
jgi:Rrf2 family transcriptional regulator, nitric oxide-sensitive transcriptional repressor